MEDLKQSKKGELLEMMKIITNNLGEFQLINVIVESTTNIRAWIPVLIEMIKKDIGIIEVYSSIEFNDDYTDLLIGTTNQSNYSIQINTTVQKFNEYLDFFAKRTREGDNISVWESIGELEELIDEKAKANDIAQQSKKEIGEPTTKEEIPNEIKLLSPEELAAELISFAKKEYPDQEDEKWISIHRIANSFWRSKNIKKWDLSLDKQLKLEKAERLAQKQLESEREVKEKEKLLSLINPCVEWAKERGLKKVTESDIDAFLLDRNIDVTPRTKRRALRSLVDSRLKSE